MRVAFLHYSQDSVSDYLNVKINWIIYIVISELMRLHTVLCNYKHNQLCDRLLIIFSNQYRRLFSYYLD